MNMVTEKTLPEMGKHARKSVDAPAVARRGRHARPGAWEELERREKELGLSADEPAAAAPAAAAHAAALDAPTAPESAPDPAAPAAHAAAPDAAAPAAPDPAAPAAPAAAATAPAAPPAAAAPAAPAAKSVARSTAIMSLCTLASRATGFIRTWAMAFALGNTILAAGFSLANNLPNMIYELVAGGVLSTAFLPIYLQQLNNRGQKEANRYASNLFSITVIMLGVIALLASIFAPQVMVTQSLFSNAADSTVESAVWFFRFFAFQIIFYGISAIIGGILNAEREFFWPAISSIFMNVITIATFLWYRLGFSEGDPMGLVVLASGVTLSIAVMAFVQVPALLKTGFRFRFVIVPKGEGLRETLRLAVPAIATTAINLVALSFMNSCALNVSETGPASVSYAWMWYQFPYGVLGVALSTALFTEMSEATARNDWPRFKQTMVGGLRTTWLLIIPMAAMVFACAHQLIGLYSAGRFSPDDIAPIAELLRFWAVNLPIYAGYMFVYRAYSAMKDMKTVAICNAVLTIGQVLLYMAFTGVLLPGFSLGLPGLACADICFYGAMVVVLLLILKKRMSALGLPSLVAPTAKITAASLVGGVVACLVALLLQAWVPVSSTLNAMVELVVTGCVGLAVIFVMAKLLRIKELDAVVGAVARKIKR